MVAVDQGCTLNAVMPGPGNGEVGVALLEVDRLGFPIAGQARGNGSNSQASPVLVENSTNRPTLTNRPSWMAARR